MIKSQHFALAGGQFGNRQIDQRGHLRPNSLLVRIVVFGSGLRLQRFAAVFRGRLKALDIQTTQIAPKVLEIIEAYLQFSSDFGFAGIAAHPRLAPRYCLFEAPRLPAQRARTPVHEPEAIQNRAADPEFGVVFQLNVLAWVILSHRVHQPQYPSVNEVLEQDLGRQTGVNAARNVSNVWKVIE